MLTHWQAAATDHRGNTITDGAVRVFLAGTTELAEVCSDRAGDKPIEQPFTSTDGLIAFYVSAGRYDIELEGQGWTIRWHDERIGPVADGPGQSHAIRAVDGYLVTEEV